MWNKCRILLFTRYPEAGKTKTRLIPKLGAEGAAFLQKQLTERVFTQANMLAKRRDSKTIVHYSGGSLEKMVSWLGPVNCVKQSGVDLGQRMRSAFEHTFAGGTEIAVLIGSDIPDITADLLTLAFISLLTKDVVIGPSQDGGYYLVGFVSNQASQLYPLLFEGMQWSTGVVFSNTIHRLKKAGYDVAILPILKDIDLPADLAFAKTRGLL